MPVEVKVNNGCRLRKREAKEFIVTITEERVHLGVVCLW